MQEKFKNLPLRIGVGIILLNKDNKVFVAKRLDNPHNYWQMPQGGVDGNEKFLDAALRELEEETGYRANSLTFLTMFYPAIGFVNEKLWIYFANDLENITRLDSNNCFQLNLIMLQYLSHSFQVYYDLLYSIDKL